MDDSKAELSTETRAELWVNHLQMQQSLISRMSGYSASVKNFAVTAVAGFLALYSQSSDRWSLALAALVVATLALLDIHYLRLERTYRGMFNSLRLRFPSALTDFKLEPDPQHKPSFWKVACSWSVYVFYLPILSGLLGAFFLLRILAQ